MADEDLTPEPRRRSPRNIVSLVLVAALGFWAAFNTESTKVDFLVTDIEAPLVLVILGSAVVGAAVGFLAGRRSG